MAARAHQLMGLGEFIGGLYVLRRPPQRDRERDSSGASDGSVGNAWAASDGSGGKPDADGPEVRPRPVLVYVHGAMDRSAAFLRAMRQTPGRERIAYDRRGYGRSAPVGVAATFADHTSDVFAVVPDAPVVIVGHSAGGAVALAAAQARPEQVRAVFVYEAPTPWVSWWPHGRRPITDYTPGEAADRFMRDVIGDRAWEALPEKTRQERLTEGAALQADITQLRVPAFDAARIATPVVVAHGSDTSDRHVRAAEALAATLPAGELAVISGAGHGAHMSHPREFGALVNRAVERGAEQGTESGY